MCERLKNEYKLTILPPFEIARYYVGSKGREEKAIGKWLRTNALCREYGLNEVNNDELLNICRAIN